jgi:hypothetical protein
MVAGVAAALLTSLDSARKSSKPARERENTLMHACESYIAALSLLADEAGQLACFAAFIKTTAKTTTIKIV